MCVYNIFFLSLPVTHHTTTAQQYHHFIS